MKHKTQPLLPQEEEKEEGDDHDEQKEKEVKQKRLMFAYWASPVSYAFSDLPLLFSFHQGVSLSDSAEAGVITLEQRKFDARLVLGLFPVNAEVPWGDGGWYQE